MMETLGRLYVAGITPNFQMLDRQGMRKRLSLPSYPFEKKRYWITEVGQYLDQPTEVVTP